MQRIELYKEFFAYEKEYYAKRLISFEEGKKYTFNFWAGLLGLAWFCYRKMYLYSVIIFLSSLVLFYILNNPALVIPVSFIALGFLGNYLYIKRSKEIVEGFISTHDLESLDYTKATEIRQKGGTSMVSALVCVGLLIVLQLVFIGLAYYSQPA